MTTGEYSAWVRADGPGRPRRRWRALDERRAVIEADLGAPEALSIATWPAATSSSPHSVTGSWPD